MAIVIKVQGDHYAIIQESNEVVVTKRQHEEWLEWYRKYISAVRNEEHPEFRTRDSFGNERSS